jgi:hypothetical protein
LAVLTEISNYYDIMRSNMARTPEDVSQYQPDTQPTEPRLPKAEIGENAFQLIQDFERTLRDTPEFTQALVDAFWAKALTFPYRDFSEYACVLAGDTP